MIRPVAAFLSLTLVACLSLDAHGERCTESLACGGGASCYRGFCVDDESADPAAASVDAAVVDAASVPASQADDPGTPASTSADAATTVTPVDAGAADAGLVVAVDASISVRNPVKTPCGKDPECSKGKGNTCKPCEAPGGGP